MKNEWFANESCVDQHLKKNSEMLITGRKMGHWTYRTNFIVRYKEWCWF